MECEKVRLNQLFEYFTKNNKSDKLDFLDISKFQDATFLAYSLTNLFCPYKFTLFLIRKTNGIKCHLKYQDVTLKISLKNFLLMQKANACKNFSLKATIAQTFTLKQCCQEALKCAQTNRVFTSHYSINFSNLIISMVILLGTN